MILNFQVGFNTPPNILKQSPEHNKQNGCSFKIIGLIALWSYSDLFANSNIIISMTHICGDGP